MAKGALRNLILILGDQLDHQASGLDGFDPQKDRLLMIEAIAESTHVPCSKQRLVIFLAAMRHFAQELIDQGAPLHYVGLQDAGNTGTLGGELQKTMIGLKPQCLVMTAPGDWRVLEEIKSAAASHGTPLDIREDRHFFSTIREFHAHRHGRKQLRLEYWYREMRSKHGVLMKQGKPIGNAWNFDSENRAAFGKNGPSNLPAPSRFKPDAITQAVIKLVNKQFKDHPGSVSEDPASFGWPVNRQQALHALDRFIQERLPSFGTYQDAMWLGEPWLYHAHLSSALNLKLLSAKEVVARAEAAFHEGKVPLNAAEGFIRQILGWREYVRGIYWTSMPNYANLNALGAVHDLPAFFWTGQTPMACLRDTIGQTLKTGYAHHIQRLMVTGLYALLFGVRPKAVHEWYLSVYVDAVEWVELPNSLGMSQHADGGLMASKPYCASGKYINRMSNYCAQCPYKPDQSIGPQACPFTTLYWDFLARHKERFSANPRMVMQIKNLARLDAAALQQIKNQAQSHRASVSPKPPQTASV